MSGVYGRSNRGGEINSAPFLLNTRPCSLYDTNDNDLGNERVSGKLTVVNSPYGIRELLNLTCERHFCQLASDCDELGDYRAESGLSIC